jgi:hypothetical protein
MSKIMPFGNVINFDNKDYVITYTDNVLQFILLEDMHLNLFYENNKIDTLFKSYMLDEYDIYIKTSNIFSNEYIFNGPDINKILNMQQHLPYIFYSYLNDECLDLDNILSAKFLKECAYKTNNLIEAVFIKNKLISISDEFIIPHEKNSVKLFLTCNYHKF